MRLYEVPLRSVPEQFNIYMGGQQYKLSVRWNGADDAGWILDLMNLDGSPIISGIPLVVGCDLLAEYKYLGIPGSLVVFSFQTLLAPGLNSLGNVVKLGYISED